MITNLNNRNTRATYGGLSTDTKPTNASNCSVFVEINTGKIFMFDKTTGTWLEQSNIVIAL